MRYRSRERGISLVGLMFVLVVAAFVGLIGMKLFPIYTESFKIDQAMKGLILDSKIGEHSKREIQAALIRHLDIDGVTVVDHRNIMDHLTITSSGGNVSIHLEYEKVTDLFGNISLLITFEKHVAT